MITPTTMSNKKQLSIALRAAVLCSLCYLATAACRRTPVKLKKGSYIDYNVPGKDYKIPGTILELGEGGAPHTVRTPNRDDYDIVKVYPHMVVKEYDSPERPASVRAQPLKDLPGGYKRGDRVYSLILAGQWTGMAGTVQKLDEEKAGKLMVEFEFELQNEVKMYSMWPCQISRYHPNPVSTAKQLPSLAQVKRWLFNGLRIMNKSEEEESLSKYRAKDITEALQKRALTMEQFLEFGYDSTVDADTQIVTDLKIKNKPVFKKNQYKIVQAGKAIRKLWQAEYYTIKKREEKAQMKVEETAMYTVGTCVEFKNGGNTVRGTVASSKFFKDGKRIRYKVKFFDVNYDYADATATLFQEQLSPLVEERRRLISSRDLKPESSSPSLPSQDKLFDEKSQQELPNSQLLNQQFNGYGGDQVDQDDSNTTQFGGTDIRRLASTTPASRGSSHTTLILMSAMFGVFMWYARQLEM